MKTATRPPRGGLLQRIRRGRVHVVGASGAEGIALLLYLAGEKGVPNIVAHDFSGDPRAFARSFRKANTAWDRTKREEILARVRRLPIELRLGDRYLEGLREADVILASQNWFNYPANLPAIPDAVAAGARLFGVADLALDLFEGIRIGVTGSNGKSTTAALITHLLQAGFPTGRQVLQGGNDRSRQVELGQIERGTALDYLVWEVSNRHLRDRTPTVDIAVITNITRNHIEDHGSWEAYLEAKLRLGHGAATGGQVVISAVDPACRRHTHALRAAGARVWRFGAPPPPGYGLDGLAWIDDEGIVRLRRPRETDIHHIGPISDLSLAGEHNHLNLLAAVCAAVAGGVEPARLTDALEGFAPLEGRLETVAEQDGVRWIYDIQATTAPAATAGIQTVGADGPIVLLVGGDDKGMDYRAMADAAAVHCALVVALPGSGTDAFLAALGHRIDVEHVADLDAAIAVARERAASGSSVLLSPGSAFFHSRYIEGGQTFGRRVQAALGSA